jgi:hypothetical protein
MFIDDSTQAEFDHNGTNDFGRGDSPRRPANIKASDQNIDCPTHFTTFCGCLLFTSADRLTGCSSICRVTLLSPIDPLTIYSCNRRAFHLLTHKDWDFPWSTLL